MTQETVKIVNTKILGLKKPAKRRYSFEYYRKSYRSLRNGKGNAKVYLRKRGPNGLKSTA